MYALLSFRLGTDSLVFEECTCILMLALSMGCINDPKAQSDGDANGCWSVVGRLRKSGAGGTPGEAHAQKCLGSDAAVTRQGL